MNTFMTTGCRERIRSLAALGQDFWGHAPLLSEFVQVSGL